MQNIQLDASEVIQELTKQHVEETTRLKQQLAMTIVEARAWRTAYLELKDRYEAPVEHLGAEGTEA